MFTTFIQSGISKHQPIHYYFGYAVPDPAPDLPVGFSAFIPPVVNVGSSPPKISKFSETATANETIPIIGNGFDESTTFKLHAQSTTYNITPEFVDSDTVAITLPSGISSWDVYSLWPVTSGEAGISYLINRTEAWWVGPKTVWAGEEFSIYGRNLSNLNGTTDAWIYLNEDGVGGQWLTPTAVNPYRVTVTLPSGLSPGTYEIWAHNGHGQENGWSGPLTLTVVSRSPWPLDTDTIIDVTASPYNATGDGSTDDIAAIRAAMTAAAAAAPATLYFPSGTYMISEGFVIYSDIRIKGDGVANSIIKNTADWAIYDFYYMPLYANNRSNVAIENITLDNNEVNNGTWDGMIRLDNMSKVRLDNVNIVSYAGMVTIQSDELLLNGCNLLSAGTWFSSSSNVLIDSCTSKESNHYGQALGTWGGSEWSVTNCIFQDADTGRSDGYAGGRVFVAQSHFGSVRKLYFEGNESIDYAPHTTRPDQNCGEQILFEMSPNSYPETCVPQNPTAVTDTTVTFTGSDMTFDESTPNHHAVIVSGLGKGQCRYISSFDMASQTITLEKAWLINPDTSSQIAITPLVSEAVVYNNTLQGRSTWETQTTASAGYVSYGASFDIIVDSNDISQTRTGMYVSPLALSTSDISVCYFTLMEDNTVDYSQGGIYLQGNYSSAINFPGVDGSIGTIMRGTGISNITDIAIRIDCDNQVGGDLNATIIEGNTITSAGTDISIEDTTSNPSNTQVRNVVNNQ